MPGEEEVCPLRQKQLVIALQKDNQVSSVMHIVRFLATIRPVIVCFNTYLILEDAFRPTKF
jgi:hypothetical protein